MPGAPARRLTAAALAIAAVALVVPAGAADPGQFRDYSYRNAKGSLTYKVYTPPAAGVRPTALVVVLPGAGETSDAAATRSRWNVVARRLRFVVAYPEQNPAY